MEITLPLKNPKPDIKGFCDVIRRKKVPARPPLVELIIDQGLIRHLMETGMDRKWVVPENAGDGEAFEAYHKNLIDFWYYFGYDYIRVSGGLEFKSKHRVTEDTAGTSGGKRSWTEEGIGVISSWEDFEKYPWPSPEKVDFRHYGFVSKNLPPGMGMFVCPSSGVLEILLNRLMGYQGLSYAIYDQPDLVEAVFNRVGEIILGFYKRAVGLKGLYGFFQGDDMGFKTATLISPDALRKYVLPWHKRIASLAHEHGLLYLFHTCGNLESIMEDLIADVKIDAKHSFEDTIMPVAEFKKKYGDRIAVLGGIDVDMLGRASPEELRKYIRNVLKSCIPGGGYALGSGNSIANYIPAENYLIMLEEGLNWGR